MYFHWIEYFCEWQPWMYLPFFPKQRNLSFQRFAEGWVGYLAVPLSSSFCMKLKGSCTSLSRCCFSMTGYFSYCGQIVQVSVRRRVACLIIWGCGLCRKFGKTNDCILASLLPLSRPWIWTHHAEVLDYAWDSRHSLVWKSVKSFKNGK